MSNSLARLFLPFALFSSSVLVACGGAPEPAVPASAAPPVPANPVVAVAPATSAEASPKAEPIEAVPESVVDVSFEPLVAGVSAGSHFLLAAHFRIAPGFRIAWKVAGDVGSPTVVTFRGPPGFDIGIPQFPAPQRFTVAGGYVGYGYEKETAVFVDVKAPTTLRHSDVSRFDLDASWVACKKQCSGEHTSAFVELETVGGPAPSKEAETTMAPFRAKLPKPVTELAGAQQEWTTDERSATLVVKLPGTTPRDFFPDKTADPAPLKTEMGNGEVRFTYDEAPRPGSRPLRGVIVATLDDGNATSFDFEASIPGLAPPKTDATPAKKPKRPPKHP